MATFNNITLLVFDAIAQAQTLLGQFFQSAQFGSGLRLAFGEGISATAVEELAEQAASPDGLSLPSIEVRSSAELNGALGAFVAETNQILLSESLFEDGNLELAVAVLLEEIGHGLDSILNPAGEAPGDEGAIFSAVVRGVELSDQQVQTLRQEDDTVSLEIDGQVRVVEQATITVDTLVDEADGSITDGDISLRDALSLAASGDTITFANGGTIALDATLGELVIDQAVSIDGDVDGDGEGDITLDAQGNSRVLRVDNRNYSNEITVSLSHLTITGGSAFRGDPPLSVYDTGSGGGIYNREFLTITNSTISGNSAGAGGGIDNSYGSVRLVNSTVSGNSARAFGGGIDSSDYFGSIRLVNSTVSGNTAGTNGGGIFNSDYGASSLVNSTVSGNTAERGGGIFNSSPFSSTSLANSIISGNTASVGNEIFDSDSGYYSGTFSRGNNLLGDGSQNNAAAFEGFTPDLTGSDLVATTDGNLGTGGIALDAILDPAGLQDNGGPTETIALVAGSPALNAGDNSAAIILVESDFDFDLNEDGDTDDRLTSVDELAFDQRGAGFDRIVNTQIDIGAFELQNPAPTTAQFLFSLENNTNLGGVTYTEQDILQFDGTDVSLFFDGSDVLPSKAKISAFDVISDTEILLSFSLPLSLSGLGRVDDSDIVKFTATSLGHNTTGQFSSYFDGSDVGLSSSTEDIDALASLPNGSLLISTTGNVNAPGVSLRDEDVLLFTPNSLGQNTSGAFSVFFDGSDVGLRNRTEDVDALSLDTAGDLFFSTTGNFSVPGVSGRAEDIFGYTPLSTGAITTGNFASELFFDGSQDGGFNTDIKGIDLTFSQI